MGEKMKKTIYEQEPTDKEKLKKARATIAIQQKYLEDAIDLVKQFEKKIEIQDKIIKEWEKKWEIAGND